MTFDLAIRGGTVVTEGETARMDIGVRDGRIAALGQVGPAARDIDATGRLVLPGGVDSHCHIEQVSGAGLLNADTFQTAHRAALAGGTTTTVSFAAQHQGQRLTQVVQDYAALAARGALADYAFHMIVSDTGGPALTEDLPALIADGHRSIKVFTVYDKVRLGDEPILDLLWCARDHGALVCVHAENDGLIRWMTRRLIDSGRTAPRFHALSHPRAAEAEALHRMAIFAAFTGQPVMLFHISTAEGAAVVRAAKAAGAPVLAETCPHYLFQTEAVLAGDGPTAAGMICSPPQRTEPDQAALWRALDEGTLALVSSDHAPYRLDASGKFAHGADAPFPRIANGMPGLAARLPLMFDAMVTRGRLGLDRFVALTATAPADIFGLTGKGRIAPGADADIAIWDPEKTVTFSDDTVLDNTGYTPWAGRSVTGWPVTVIARGEVVVQDGAVTARPGRGRRIVMARSPAMTPLPDAPALRLDPEAPVRTGR